MITKTENPAGAQTPNRIQMRIKFQNPFDSVVPSQQQADFVELFVARKYRLPIALARLIAGLSNLGGRLS
jgi:hypothetical protein